MPPSPGHGHPAMVPSPGLSHAPMPSPTPAVSQVPPMAPAPASSPMNYPKTPVMNHQYQQHNQYATPPVDSPKVPTGVQVDDTVKVFVNVDDAVKVNLDDIKIPSTPSTPATSATGYHSKTPSTPATPATGNHSRNPQLRNSYVQPSADESKSILGTTDQFSYQPPPFTTAATTTAALPSANPYAIAAQVVQPTSAATSEQNDLSYKLSQMGLGSSPVPPVLPPRQSSSSYTSPPGHSTTTVTSPTTTTTNTIGHAQPPPSLNLQPGGCSSSMYPNPTSPVSAAAIGAVVASQQQHPTPQSQPVQVHGYPPQPQPQQQYGAQKQQVWIPMYQTIGGKAYVQYKLAA